MILIDLLTNPLVLSVLIAWFVPGVFKYAVSLARKENKSFAWQMFRTGGMPSAHSAIVTAAVTSVYITEGLTTLFYISAVFSLVIIRDSFGVRWSVGEQARVLNDLARHDHLHEKVKVVLGHTLWQVIVGILFGAIIAIGVHLLT